MKNKLKLIGIIALTVVIGFSVISCPEPEEKNANIVGTWVKEMSRSEVLEYAAETMNIPVASLEAMLELQEVEIPSKVTSDKLVFTEETATYYTVELNMTAIMTAVALGEEINWEGLLQEVSTNDYSMDGNNLMYDSDVVGAISGKKLTIYDFYEEGENAVFTKK